MRSFPLFLALAAIHIAQSAPVHHTDRRQFTPHTSKHSGGPQGMHHSKRQSTISICFHLGLLAIICPKDKCDGSVTNVDVDDLLFRTLGLLCSDQLGASPPQPATESHQLSGSIGNRPLGSNANPVDNNGQPQNANQDPGNSQPTSFSLPNSNPPPNPSAGLDGSQRQNGDGTPDGGENGGASGDSGNLFGGNTGPAFLGFPSSDANPGDNIGQDTGDGPTGILPEIKVSLHLGGRPSSSRSSSTSQISGSGTSNASGSGDSNGNGNPTPADNQPDGNPTFSGNQGLDGTPDTNSNGFQGDGTPNSNGIGSQGDSFQPTVGAGNGGTDNGPIGSDGGGLFGGNTGPTFLGFPGPERTKDGGTGGFTATVSTSLLENNPPISSASSPSRTSRNGVENVPGNSNGSGDIFGPSHGGDDAFDPSDSRPAFAGHFPQGPSDGPSDSPQLAGLPHDSQPAGFGDSLPDGSPGDSGSGTPRSNGKVFNGPDHPSDDDSPSNDAHPDHRPFNDVPPLGEDPSADPFNGISPSDDGHLNHPHDDSQVGHDHPDHPRHHSQFGDGNPNHLFNGDSHFGDENLNQPHDDDTQIENPGHSHSGVPPFGDNHFDHPFDKDSQSGGDHSDHSREEDPHFGDNHSDHPFDSRFGGRLPNHFRDNAREHPDPPFHEHSHSHQHSQVGGDHLDHFRDNDSHGHSGDEDPHLDDRLHLGDHHFSHPADEGSESHDRLGNHFNDGSYFDGDGSNGRPFNNNPLFGDNDPDSHATRIDGGHFDDVHSDGGTHFGEGRSHDDPQNQSLPGDGPFDGPRVGHHQHRPHQVAVNDWQPDGSHDPLPDGSQRNDPSPPRFAPFGPGPVKFPYHSHDEPIGFKDEQMSHSCA